MILMLKTSVFILLACHATGAFAGCLSNDQLGQLTQKEVSYLTEKIPPVFKHTLQANQINVTVQGVDDEACKASLVVMLPQADIDEANAILDAQPAKKIMLSAQGYALPQGTEHQAMFSVDSDKLAIADADILQTAPLGKLRASLELMYAFLTQKRAEVTQMQLNDVPWTNEIKQQELTNCGSSRTSAVCACMVDQYALKIPANQMEYIQYVRTNPYALAMGANQVYEEIKQKAEVVCAG
jgi:hypothetical protein